MSGALGVILAGGASRRMGTDKALVDVAGVPMVERVGSVLARVATGGVVVSGRTGTLAGYECVPDQDSGRSGPLSGLATMLTHQPAGVPLVAVAVDHPFVRVETLRGLVDSFERLDGMTSVVPVADGIRQVTLAAYGAGLASLAQDVVAEGGSVQTLLDRTGFTAVFAEEWRQWGEDGRSWFSVDSEEILAEGLSRYGSGLASL